MSGEFLEETFSFVLAALIALGLIVLSVVLLALRRFTDVMGSLPEVYFGLVFVAWVWGAQVSVRRGWSGFEEAIKITVIQLGLFTVIVLCLSWMKGMPSIQELILPCVLIIVIQIGTFVTERWHAYAESALRQHPETEREFEALLRTQAFIYLSIPIGSATGAVFAHWRQLTGLSVFRTELACILMCACIWAFVSIARSARAIASPLLSYARRVERARRQGGNTEDKPLSRQMEDVAVDLTRVRTIFVINNVHCIICVAIMIPQVAMLLNLLGAFPVAVSEWYDRSTFEAAACYFLGILGLALFGCLLPCELGDRETTQALVSGLHGTQLVAALKQLGELQIEEVKLHRRLISVVVPLASATTGKLIATTFKIS